MECIICNSPTKHYLTKSNFLPEYAGLVKLIGNYEYSKCSNCGFVQCDTIINLNPLKWTELNNAFHNFVENNPVPTNQPPYAQQALMIKILAYGNIINLNKTIDFAAGYGTLSKILNDFFELKLPVYDPYVTANKYNVNYIENPVKGAYQCVISSALFEHITSISTLNEIDEFLTEDGKLIIHTVVCENIPKDEKWFYFEPPVHSAFHTNKSMTVFMDKYNYESSVYCPSAKCWILFKKDSGNISKYIESINNLFQTDYFIYKKGFVDYWKGF